MADVCNVHTAVHCTVAGIGNVHAAMYSPNGRFWEYLHSGPSAQWQISICFLLSVHNVLYSGARGIWI